MPTPYDVRQQRRFRPLMFTDRHRLVVLLRVLGQTRGQIAEQTGYSRSHISRIAWMEEARKETQAIGSRFEQTLVDSTLRRLFDSGPIGRHEA